MSELRAALRAPQGAVDLGALPTDAVEVPDAGFRGGKTEGRDALAALGPELAELQERLYAEAYVGGHRRLLLVVQGMDTAGKGGVMRRVVGLLDPSGMRLKAFKRPTEEELAHDFLWRIERELPAAGQIGVFDRSHYEDVLVARVHGLAPPDEIERRYGAIADWERRLAESGTTVVKCLLHVSRETQRERLLARLDDPLKQWKFKPADIDERGFWDDYREAYEVAVERTDADHAPWYVVPADRKWARDLAVARLLLEHLRELDPQWPSPDFDVAEQRARLTDEPSE
ncbi:hypothetical protein GCM10027425_11990 [Alteromonas gracilis]